MFRKVLFHTFLAIPAMTLLAGPAAAAPEAPLTTETLLRQAIRSTASGKLENAQKLYRDLVTSAPSDGYPALARFLARTGQTTAARELLDETALKQLSVGVRARVAVAAGVPKDAVELLLKAQGVEKSYEQTLLLANQLELLGRKEEACRVLDRSIRVPELAMNDRRDLFLKLIQIGDAKSLASNLPSLVDSLVHSTNLGFEAVRDLANTGLNALAASADYLEFRKSLEAAKKDSAAMAWLGAIAAIKRGDVPQALSDLEQQTSRSLAAREKLMINEELARLIPEDYARTYKLYSEIIPSAPDGDRLRIVAAQSAYFLRKYDDAISLLEQIDRSKLDDLHREPYSVTKLRCIAAGRPAEQLVAAFEKEVQGLNWAKMTDLARKSFDRIPETEQHQKVKQAVEARLAETTAPVELQILRMATYGELRDWDSVIAAMQVYTEARPNDIPALEEYADNVTLRAYRLVAGDHETTPSEEQLKKMADTAAKALWKLVAAKPYVPDNYAKLMELYRLYGQPEKAKLVPMGLISGTTATAEQYNLAAYILATNNYAQDALPLYEHALKLDANNPRILFNYVGALKRASRYAEAQKILLDLVRHGTHGHQYNMDDLFASLYETADKLQQVPSLIKTFEAMIEDRSIPEHAQVVLTAGDVLASHQHTDEAVKFYDAFIRLYPDQAGQAQEKLLEVWVAKKEFAKAEQLISSVEKESTATADVISMKYNRAYLKSQQGQLDAAVGMWKQLAEQYPRERSATRGLITSAQMLMQAQRIDEARKLAEQYLAMDTGDNESELAARELILTVKNQERRMRMMNSGAQAQTSGTSVRGSK